MKPIKFRSFFRLGIFISYVTPLVATSIVWEWIFHPDYGILNSLLKLLHLPPSPWLIGFPSALFALVIYNTWHELGYSTILFMAGLTAVNKELQEAAEIDRRKCKWCVLAYHMAVTFTDNILYFYSDLN